MPENAAPNCDYNHSTITAPFGEKGKNAKNKKSDPMMAFGQDFACSMRLQPIRRRMLFDRFSDLFSRTAFQFESNYSMKFSARRLALSVAARQVAWQASRRAPLEHRLERLIIVETLILLNN